MSDGAEATPIRVRPSELAAAMMPLLLLVWGLYVAAELVWACAQLLLLLAAATLVALLVSRVSTRIEETTGLPLKIGSSLVLLVLALLLGLFLYLAGSQILAQASHLVTDVPEIIGKWQQSLEQTETGRKVVTTVLRGTGQMSPTMFFGNMKGLFSSAVGFLAGTALFIVISFYLSIDPRTYWRGFLALLKTPERKRRGFEVLSALADQLWHFLLGQMVTMTALAVMTTVGLWALGIPSFLVLGLLAGGLSFIPLLGPTLAFIPALLVASSEGATAFYSVVALYAGIQFLEGNFLTPIIQRHMTSIPPVLLMATQAVMGLLFGFIGVALAAPAAVTLMVLVDELYVKEGRGGPQDRTIAVLPETTTTTEATPD